jgi:hypothetical protein
MWITDEPLYAEVSLNRKSDGIKWTQAKVKLMLSRRK